MIRTHGKNSNLVAQSDTTCTCMHERKHGFHDKIVVLMVKTPTWQHKTIKHAHACTRENMVFMRTICPEFENRETPADTPVFENFGHQFSLLQQSWQRCRVDLLNMVKQKQFLRSMVKQICLTINSLTSFKK